MASSFLFSREEQSPFWNPQQRDITQLAKDMGMSLGYQVTASVAALAAHTLTPALENGCNVVVVLDANATIANPTLGRADTGTVVRFSFIQDGTGGHSVSFGTAYADASSFSLRQGAGQASSVEFILKGDGTLALHDSSSSASANVQVVPSVAALVSHTLTPVLATASSLDVTLDANLTVANPTVGSTPTGTEVRFTKRQDSTGYRSITWGANFSGVSNVIPKQGPGMETEYVFELNADGTLTLVSHSGIDTTRPLHPANFGAKADGTDDTTALQAYLNQAAVHSGFNPDVSTVAFDLGVGAYRVNKPLTLPTASGVAVDLYGAGRTSTIITGVDPFFGPVLFCASNYAAASVLPTAAPLVGASGLSYNSSYNCPWLNLSEVACSEVNGLAALTKRFWLKPSSVSTADYVTGAVGAALGPGGESSSGLCITITTSGAPGGKYSITATLTTANSVYTLNSATGSAYFDIGSATYVSAEYDGADFALYAGPAVGTATRVDHTAATGAVVRYHMHDETFSHFTPKYPASNGALNQLVGSLFSFEILSSRVHSSATTSFTAPVAMHAASSTTRVLLNLDSFDRCFVVGNSRYAGAQSCYLPVYADFNSGAVSARENIHVRDLYLNAPRGVALGFQSILHSSFKNLTLTGYSPLVGHENSYSLKFENLRVTAISASSGLDASNAAVQMSNTAGTITHWDHIWITGGKTLIAMGGGYWGLMNQVYVQPTADVVIGVILFGEPNSKIEWKAFEVDGEGTWSNFRIGVYAGGGAVCSFDAPLFEWSGSHSGDTPSFKLGSISTFRVSDGIFSYAGSPTKHIQFDGAPGPSYPPETMTLTNCKQTNGTAIPWTDSSNAYRLTIDGAQRSAVADVDYTALVTDKVIAYKTLTGAHTVTLPDASKVPNGWKVTLKDEAGTAGSHTITAQVVGGGTIDGASTKTITTNFGELHLYGNGTQWFTE